MPALTDLGTWTSPSTTSFFAQKPGSRFAAVALSLIPFPIAGRARLDLSETETRTRRYEITRNPVERLVAQNKIRQSDTLTLVGRLSAHPLLSPGMSQLGIARLDKRELTKLLDIVDGDDPMFIVTPERPYSNMVCTEITEHYDDTTGDGVALSLSFAEIMIAIPGMVEPELDFEAMLAGASGSSDLGAQAGEAVSTPAMNGAEAGAAAL